MSLPGVATETNYFISHSSAFLSMPHTHVVRTLESHVSLVIIIIIIF